MLGDSDENTFSLLTLIIMFNMSFPSNIFLHVLICVVRC